MQKTPPLDLPRLKELIHLGINSIKVEQNTKEAILVIGDTGSGKSTIISFLSGCQLVIRYDGLKPTLDNVGHAPTKIGHDKYSETSVPKKIMIDGTALYDCPGFNDNKGEEYEISNSFFVQRLLDLHQRVKLVLVVNESHISETRADKLPKLIHNLHKSFTNLDEIKDGVIMIVNRAVNKQEDYCRQLKMMMKLSNENGSLFNQQEKNFLEHLLYKKRVLTFSMAGKQNQHNGTSKFNPTNGEKDIMNIIKQATYIRSRHIENIISESSKLAIRDYMDQITEQSDGKIEVICNLLKEMYRKRTSDLGKNLNGVLQLKEKLVGFAQLIEAAEGSQFLKIMQQELPEEDLKDFAEDFLAVLFFRQLYDRTEFYFSNLVNKTYAQLSLALGQLDKKISIIKHEIQKEEEEEAVCKRQEKKRQEEEEEERIRKRQEQRWEEEEEERMKKKDEKKRKSQNIQAKEEERTEKSSANPSSRGISSTHDSKISHVSSVQFDTRQSTSPASKPPASGTEQSLESQSSKQVPTLKELSIREIKKQTIHDREQEKNIARRHCQQMQTLKSAGRTSRNATSAGKEHLKLMIMAAAAFEQSVRNVKREALQLRNEQREFVGELNRLQAMIKCKGNT